jgi:hypothetical protein
MLNLKGRKRQWPNCGKFPGLTEKNDQLAQLGQPACRQRFREQNASQAEASNFTFRSTCSDSWDLFKCLPHKITVAANAILQQRCKQQKQTPWP